MNPTALSRKGKVTEDSDYLAGGVISQALSEVLQDILEVVQQKKILARLLGVGPQTISIWIGQQTDINASKLFDIIVPITTIAKRYNWIYFGDALTRLLEETDLHPDSLLRNHGGTKNRHHTGELDNE